MSTNVATNRCPDIQPHGAQLYVTQEGSQDRVPEFAEGSRAFFLKVIDAQVTCVAAGDGPASAALWRQGGKEERGERVE